MPKKTPASAPSGRLVRPARCPCGADLPWHIVALAGAGHRHHCGCARTYAAESETILVEESRRLLAQRPVDAPAVPEAPPALGALGTLYEIEQRVAAALRAGDEAIINLAARAVTASGLDDVLPDSAYAIRDITPDLWCFACDVPLANPVCSHDIAASRKAYLGEPPRLLAKLVGKPSDLHKVLIPDGAGAALLLKMALPSWAEGCALIIEVRLGKTS